MKLSTLVESAGCVVSFLVKILDSPLVGGIINLGFSSNISSFLILLSFDRQDFALLIVEVGSIESEELVPVAVDTISVTVVVSNINGIVVITLASNGSGLVIEVEGLSSSSIVGLDNESV